TLLINKLTVNDVTLLVVETEDVDTSTEDLALPDIKLPLRIKIKQITVDNVQTVSSSNDNTVLINQLNTAIDVNYDSLQIHQLSVDRNDIAIALNGGIELQSPYQTRLKYDLTLKQLLAKPLEVAGDIHGDLQRLTLNQTITAPIVSTQSISVTNILSDMNWSLLLEADALNVADIVPEQSTQLKAVTLTAKGDLDSVDATLSSQVIQPELPAIELTADIDSDDLKVWRINSQAALSEQSMLNLAGDISINDATPTVDLKAIWKNMQWPLTGEEIFAKSSTGSLLVSGTAQAYTASLETDLEWQQQALEVSAETAGTQNDIDIKQLSISGLDGKLNADGRVDWHATPMQYQFNADWHGLKLPESLTDMTVLLEQGNINLTGTPEALNLTTQAKILLDGVQMAVDAKASGQTNKGFEQTRLDIALAQGGFSYQGKLLWAEALLMEGELMLDKLNPGVLATQWPGSLSGNTHIVIENKTETGLHVQANKIDITGTLRQRPLQVSGAVDYSQSLIDIKQLQLESGDSSLQANGQMQHEIMAFDWVLKSPDLQDFYPDLSGQMDASGNIKGTLQAPELKAKLAGGNLRYRDIKAQALTGDINLAMSDNAELDSRIEVTGLGLPHLPIDTVNLHLTGQQKNHQLTVDIASEPLTLMLSATGGLNERIWQGNINRFSMENEKAGKWSLQQQDELIISAEEQHIPEHCWASNNGNFCLQADNSSKGWQTAGQFDAVPLSLFEAFVIQLEQLQGTLRGDFNVMANKGEAITGEGEVFLDDATLKLEQEAFNQQKPITLNNTFLNYRVDADKTHARIHLEPAVDGVSAIEAEFDTAGLTTFLENPDSAPINGRINTAIQDLSQLQISHPAFTDIKGKFDLNVTVSGTTAQPQIKGQANLINGEIGIVDAGIVLKQIEANINGNLEQVTFDYQATSGKGTLNGDGTFTLTDKNWELKTDLKADQFRVMNTPEALVIAEPDLTILVTPKLTKVTGQVTIPEAELEPTQFNSTVSPSRDVVVVRDESEDEQSGPSTEVDIKIILGDKVKLKAAGFQGRLTGDLAVSGNTNDILLGNGEIKIKDGSYLAYGKLLQVNDGSIRYAGGAIDNPELDIKAVRVGEDYKAGLHIEGYASSPQATLFSTPDMSQDDILSYILLGKPIDKASATDAALLASAASGLGLQNGAMIGDGIASTFGLDEFTVRGDSAENAALQVGKYLSPKLYLSYGIGVFDSVSTVELRYQLSKIWSLKAESGTESGIDLLYTYERGGPE
ncbi:translocation/assembly module TamB domain-containing protein, partial [Methylophaga sp.]|uniref:translocation/assembly module TamB domain-containing protein n=1 Tax=Methylophaga sp. TaxID=2024840 RepID=UPI003F696272